MRRLSPLAPVLGTILAFGSPAATLAGVPMDPNLHDTVLGTVGGLRYAMDSGVYDAGSGYGAATAGCGGSTRHLIGGGAAAGGGASQAWQAFDRPDDYTDADTEPDDGFLGSGFGPAGASFRTYSICIRNTQLQYHDTAVANQPSASRTGSAECSGSAWHVTAGSVSIATSNSWLTSSFPTDGSDAGTLRDDGWRGTAHDTVNGLGGFYVFAICAKGIQLHYVQGGPRTVDAGHATSGRVACGAGEHVVGGGVRASGSPAETRLVVSAPYDGADADHVPDDGWRTSVYNLTGSSKRVTSFAICKA